MKPIIASEWIPADGFELEENALTVVKSDNNNLVIAGPGAGKTELLAQRASYLLQTDSCKFPHKILAISFKKDAARNLKERVELRCGSELAKRFTSLTFDGFAKQLLDNFGLGLPDEYKVSLNYEIVFDETWIHQLYRDVDYAFFNSNNKGQILKTHTGVRLPFNVAVKEGTIAKDVWTKILNSERPKLTFNMVKRLAELVVNSNPILKSYLQQTYHYVFLDEFQDTTDIQYELFKSCFLNGSGIYTAVGDDKQRIMLWAGARMSVFDDFVNETGATELPLVMNFRSAPKLVELQNYLVKNLLNKDIESKPSPKWKGGEGETFVWVFKNQENETKILFDEVNRWVQEGVPPREICILVKQQLLRYTGDIIAYFNSNGIKARDESLLQDVLADSVSNYLINCLSCIFGVVDTESKTAALSFLSNISSDFRDEAIIQLETSFHKFRKRLIGQYESKILDSETMSKVIDEIIGFAKKDRICSTYAEYVKASDLDDAINNFKKVIGESIDKSDSVQQALDLILGLDTIPIMTIHKSKGLEYHTVIFVGLEDGAFWSFKNQPNEDICAFFVALSRAKEKVVFTFSKERPGRYGQPEKQSFGGIKILFEKLNESGLVQIESKGEK